MDNLSEFIKALREFVPLTSRKIEYRVYYDATTGEVLNYTNEELSGTYIIVDRETFAQHRFDCKIKNGKMVPFKEPIGKLLPSDEGTPCMPNDICLVAAPNSPSIFWKMHTYED